MVRIKIKDLPRDVKIESDEMKRIMGGGRLMIGTWPTPEMPSILRYSRPGYFSIDTVPLPE
jgi:hypothetical protein